MSPRLEEIYGLPDAEYGPGHQSEPGAKTVSIATETCLACGASVGTEHTKSCINNRETTHAPSSPLVKRERVPVYMMHPLGDGANRERNRKLACLWQAEIQRAHPEWLVLAPWIGLSGAWGEDLREMGMEIDFATIDLCGGGVIAGPLDGPVIGIVHGRPYEGVSPGMARELEYFSKFEPQRKPILDARTLFKVELPLSWTPPMVGRAPIGNEFRPRFKVGDQVYVENKPHGTCYVREVEEIAHGCYRYRIERVESFFAHDQALAHVTPAAGHKV